MNHPCDFNEDDSAYLRLVRIGHAVWRQLRRDRGLFGHTVTQERANYEAVEIIKTLKDSRKTELRQERVIKSALLKAKFSLK